MSQHEKQQEMLLQLKVENQQLLKFKKISKLMQETLDKLATKDETYSIFSPLFTLIQDELKAEDVSIVVLHDNESTFSVLESTSPALKHLTDKLIYEHDTLPHGQHLFSHARIFFDVKLSTQWPAVFNNALPEVKSALIQPVRIAQHQYALVLLSATAMQFDNEAKMVLAGYSSFVASFMSLLENKRLQAERDQLFAQQKRIEQSMMQQDKLAAIGQLAAGVAHELNNPLGFIYSNLNSFTVYMRQIREFVDNACASSQSLQALAFKKNLPFILDDTAELIEESLEGARRARDIISNLRTFSHPDDTSVSRINLIELLESTLRIANTQIKRNAKLTLHKELASGYVTGNATQLSQVLLNLINNAYHAINHSHGEITVSLSKIQRWLTIKVTDNGGGISSNDQAHIFEPFFTTKDVGKGTGLGLSISQAIVEQHNGCLALEHTSPEGSTFVVSLPELDTTTDDKLAN